MPTDYIRITFNVNIEDEKDIFWDECVIGGIDFRKLIGTCLTREGDDWNIDTYIPAPSTDTLNFLLRFFPGHGVQEITYKYSLKVFGKKGTLIGQFPLLAEAKYGQFEHSNAPPEEVNSEIKISKNINTPLTLE